jgi:hypothetical protein
MSRKLSDRVSTRTLSLAELPFVAGKYVLKLEEAK